MPEITPNITELESRIGEIVKFRDSKGELKEGRLVNLYVTPTAMVESLVNGVQLPVKPSDIVSEPLEMRIARLIQNRHDEVAREGCGGWVLFALDVPDSVNEWERKGFIDPLVTQILEAIAQDGASS